MRQTTLAIRLIGMLSVGLILAGCAVAATPNASQSEPTLSRMPTLAVTMSTPPAALGTCQPPPLVVPTPPLTYPGYTELDPSTGLHMTGSVQRIDVNRYRLQVTGKVDHPSPDACLRRFLAEGGTFT